MASSKDIKNRINYTKEAFLSQYNLISLAGLGLFSLIGGGIPAAMLGVGAELLYLVLIPEMKRFRRMVDSRKAVERRSERV